MNTNESGRVRQYPEINQYMTAGPHTIGPGNSLATARKVMLDYGVRHLPVLDGGRIVGLLSERDLLLVESLPGVNPTDVRVEDAMVQSPFLVPRHAPLAEVVATMAERKLGSAVVTEGEKVVGVFTTVDALRALADALAAD